MMTTHSVGAGFGLPPFAPSVAPRPDLGLGPAVLLIDPSPAERTRFAGALSSRGFSVDTVATIDEAAQLGVSTKYSLIALHLDNVAQGGVSAVLSLAATQPECDFVLLRANAKDEVPSALSNLRVASVIDCPEDGPTLATAIGDALHLRAKDDAGLWDATSIPAAKGEGGEVLLLEDGVTSSRYMLETLVRSALPDFELTRAKLLHEGLRSIERREPDAIITQLTLGDARGVDAVRKLCQRVPHVPVVVVARREEEGLALQALRAGAQDYLMIDQLAPELIRRAVRFAVERRQANAELAATNDPRAGTTPEAFERRLAAAIGRARREQQHVAVVRVALERPGSSLAPRNSSAPPQSGVVSNILRSVREYDSVFPLSADTVSVILEGLKDGTQVEVAARRILQGLHHGGRPSNDTDSEPKSEASIGIAVFPDDADREEELVRCADMAVTRARASGVGTIEFFDEARGEAVATKRRLNEVLTRILEHDEFVLHYEPQHNPRTDRLIGFETQLHWQAPGDESLSAAHFVPLLDERGATPRLTAWMLNEACQQVRAWRRTQPDLRVSVNLSLLQLQDPQLVRKLKHALSSAQLPAAALELELPEQALQSPAARQILTVVASLGVRLVVDGFGTDTPLASLAGLDIKGIKLWPKLAESMTSRNEADAFVAAITQLAHSLKLEVSVLGVQNVAQRDKLRRMGCDRAQGTLYGPARPAAKVAPLAATG
jgi:diguanylate cyclase